jgi:hypothetical protein
MNKKTILLGSQTASIPNVPFWKKYFLEYFNVVQMRPNESCSEYDPNTHIFWGCSPENFLLSVESVLDAGFPVVLDYLWDHFGYSHISDNVLMLRSNNFIFANEVLHYNYMEHRALEFYRDADKFMLCLMNQQRPHRDQIFDKLTKYSEDSYMSYLHRGIRIANDIENDSAHNGAPNWQRYVHPDWYNKTNFSLVVETSVHDPRFYSEKILKPFAFKHPLIVWGPPTIFSRIKDLGFVGFDNVIDESYDTIVDSNQRLTAILSQVDILYKEFQTIKNIFTDKLTLEKLEHNYNLFYNQANTDNIIKQEIMGPLLEFAYG